MTYAEILAAGEAKVEATMIPFKVTQAQKQCELEICRTEEVIANLTLQAEKAKSKHPINLSAVVQSKMDLDSAKASLAIAKEAVAELFPAVK